MPKTVLHEFTLPGFTGITDRPFRVVIDDKDYVYVERLITQNHHLEGFPHDVRDWEGTMVSQQHWDNEMLATIVKLYHFIMSGRELRKLADKQLLETGGFMYTDNVQVLAKALGHLMQECTYFLPADVLMVEPKDCNTIFELKKVVQDGEEGYQLVKVSLDDPRIPKECLPK